MKKVFLMIFFACAITVTAQTATITGRVITEKNEPIGNANLIIKENQTGITTSGDGSFEIKNIQFGLYTLEISHIGFTKKEIPLILDAPGKHLTIILSERLIQGEQIIVSASKYEQRVQDLPVSTAIFSADLLSRKNYQTFDDLLRNVPGIQMNLEQVSIRGSSGYSKGSGARVFVAVNGIPIYTGDTGEIIWELIPAADIERIEIIKGPASSLYGTSAIGGVINIITKTAAKNPITQFRSYLGGYNKPSYDIWKWNESPRLFYGLEFTHSNSAGNLGYTLSLKKFDNMSYRQNDYAKRYLAYLKLNYDFGASDKITFFSDFLNMDRGNFLYWKDSRNALVPKDEDNGNIVKSDRLFSGLIYDHKFSQSFSMEFKSSYYYSKFDGYGKELTTSTAYLTKNELSAKLNLSEDLIITSGAEGSYSKISSTIFKNTSFTGGGFYAQAEYKGISKLIVTTGVRFDYMKMDTLNSAYAVTPKAGINYKLSGDIILRASLGTGFRAPTPSEVFTSTSVGAGIDVKTNPDLKAETSFSIEAGGVYNYSDDLSFDLALYQTDYKDFIEAVLTNDAKIQFQNLSKARIQGIELGADWSVLPGLLKVNCGYNYMWARDLEKNTDMKYRPRNSFNAQLRYSPNPFDFGIDFRYSSRINEIDNLLTQPPISLIIDGDLRVPVYVTDIYFGYNTLFGSTPAKLYFNVKNLFNYNYIEFIGNIAPIRNYSFSMELFF